MATRSHGVVTRAQLLAAGITTAEVRRRVGSGALLREHPGVYRVGHRAPSVEATFLAAVWACGEGAVLSGRAAAHLWGLLKGPAPAPEVTAPRSGASKASPPARARSIESDDPPRDPDHHRPPHPRRPRSRPLPRCPRQEPATRPGSSTRRRPPGRSGACDDGPTGQGRGEAARASSRGDVQVTLSELERAFRERLRDAGLPLPKTNTPAHGRRVDCRWPDRRLTVELDSYRYHHSRHAWEQDRRREREARARGDEFRRYT